MTTHCKAKKGSESILSVQFSSVAQSCLTLCNPMNRSTPGLPVHHQLLEFTQTHVHQLSDAIQPSHPLSSPSPPAPNPMQRVCFSIMEISSRRNRKNKNASPWQVEVGGLEVEERSVAQLLSRVRLFVTPGTAAHQASLSFTIS